MENFLNLSVNTKVRIYSTVFLILGLIFLVYLGPIFFLPVALLILILVLQEINFNFFKHVPWSLTNIKSLLFFLGLICFYEFTFVAKKLVLPITYILMVIEIYLIILVSYPKLKLKSLFKLELFWPFYFASLYCCFRAILQAGNALKYLLLFLSISVSVDIMGWVVGKNFGKSKLAPRISPKKTWEGAIGGVFVCILIYVIFYYVYYNEVSWLRLFQGLVLSIIAIYGDLVQSSFKRLYSLKDSSSLIPGHGGVYDRVDGHLFVIPFFVFFLLYF